MKKFHLIGFLVLLSALLLTLTVNAQDQTVVVGMNGIFDLAGAINSLGNNAGNAVIYLNDSIDLNQQVEIPSDLPGLKSVTLASYSGTPVTVSMGGGVICADGISFTVEQGVTLSNGFLVGGKCIAYPGQVSVDNTELVINGAADLVIGGGLAMNSGAVSSVNNVNVIVNGKANVVHGGGYAFNGGTAEVSGLSNLVLMRSGSVSGALYGGGYASGTGSNAPVYSAHIMALGQAGTVSENEGVMDNGGSALVGPYSTVEIVNPNPYIPVYNPPQDTTENSGISLVTDNSIIEIANPQITANPYETVFVPTQPAPVINSTVIYIGTNQQAQNFTDAVNLIPNNAGNVEFCILDDFAQNNDVIIPQNRGVISLTITGNNNVRKTAFWQENGSFFANGIPTKIESSVKFSSGIIYGGADVVSGQRSALESTYLEIAGSVSRVIAGSKARGAGAEAHVTNATLLFRGKTDSWLHAGGGALYGGYSAVDETATLVVMPGSTVEYSISAGGYAFGEGARSVVKNASLDVSGSVVYAIFLGGYADQKSSSDITGRAFLNLQAGGSVGQSVWYGGRAYNQSAVSVDTVSAEINGHVGVAVHRYGNATGGGTTNTRSIQE